MAGGAKAAGSSWSPSQIGRMLKDIRYAGYFAYNMYRSEGVGGKNTIALPMEEWTLVPDAIPAIISKEDYDKVHALLSGTDRKPRRVKRTQTLHTGFSFACSADISKADKPSSESAQAIRENRRQIKAASDRKTNLYDKYCNGSLTRDEYVVQRDEEDKLIAMLDSERLTLE